MNTSKNARTVLPTLRVERLLLRGGPRLLCAVDEVGRGAWAGVVSVGMVVVDASCGPAPKGIRDSKLLSPATREALEPMVRRWAVASAVGHAAPAEIDTVGIVAALRLAALRAADQLPVTPDVFLLDGSHDWLTPPQPTLFDAEDSFASFPPVVTRVKADMTCASVAAASVIAKVERDALMADLAAECPGYGFDVHKGYATAAHVAAVQEHGLTASHRTSWTVPVGR